MRTLELDPARWTSLVRQCRRVTGNRADAEDAVQDAALAVLRRLPALGAASTDVDAYLAVAARNAALRTIARRRAVAPLDERRDAPDPCADVHAEVQRRLLAAELRAALAGIPPRQRAALLLFDVAGCDGRQAGEQLGLAPNAVNQLVFRARGSLRARLASAREAGSPAAGQGGTAPAASAAPAAPATPATPAASAAPAAPAAPGSRVDPGVGCRRATGGALAGCSA